jgi:predicted nucleotidyltransferase
MTNPSTPFAAIGRSALPGIPERSSRQLLGLLTAHPQLEAIWLFGSRAMDRYQPGSDIDLCLDAPLLSHASHLSLLAAIDDLLLPWRVDLLLMHQLDAEVLAHIQRVGRCIWTRPSL